MLSTLTTTEMIKPVDENDPFTQRRIIKNLLVLSLAFLLICTSVDGLCMLQSTLNRQQGIGVVSSAIQFAVGFLTAILLMKFLIKKFGSKNIITVCILVHIPSTVANFYPIWLTMIPAYMLLGAAATLLWGSNSAYLNSLSDLYVNQSLKTTYSETIKTNENMEVINADNIVNGRFRSYSSVDSISHETAETEDLDLLNEPIFFSNIVKNIVEVASLTTISSHKESKYDSPRTHREIKNYDTSFTSSSISKQEVSQITSIKRRQSVDEMKEVDLNLQKMWHGDTSRSENYAESNNILPCFYESKPCQSNIINSKCSAFSDNEKSGFSSSFIDSTTARFFGFHSMLYQSGHIWSNVVSFFVLQHGVVDDTYIHNSSCSCGADFCNVETACFENNLKPPTAEVKYLLISIFIALNVLAVLLTAFLLDPLERKGNNEISYSFDFALATLNQLRKPLQLLIVPLSMYMGMTQGFFYADFPKAFVGCAWGMHHVGLVTIAYGISSSVMSTLSAWLVKLLGRRTVFLGVFSMNVAVNVLMLTWQPDSNHPFMFFIIAAMWGFVMASFWSQLKAFHGILFKHNQEAAFACYELCHCIGACLSFACSNILCAYVKIYMMLLVSTVGIVGYITAEKYRLKIC